MIRIRFPDAASERRALGYLIGRFSFKSLATGESFVPETALPALAVEGIRFTVEGPAPYEQLIPRPQVPELATCKNQGTTLEGEHAAEPTIPISKTTLARLRELARWAGISINEALDRAIKDQYDRNFWEATNAGYAAMRAEEEAASRRPADD